MYHRSDDLRFVKNRQTLQRAFIDLTLQKRTMRITVKELAERAGVNRMTFYSHYDEVSDVLAEFVDELTEQIMGSETVEDDVRPQSIESVLRRATEAMQDELEFFRLVAQDAGFELYRVKFREAFAAIFAESLGKNDDAQGATPSAEETVIADMLASGVTYAYLDWLAGRYGDLPLEELVEICERFAEYRISCGKRLRERAK